MAILQALLALIAKSAGKILNAVFGWAVHALFGKTTSRDQTVLSALVGAAVAWPLLAAGVIAPKVAAFALTFVPLPHSVPSWVVRLVWLTLALAVPIALGLTVASRRPANTAAEPFIKRVLRGFPLTIGLALAFLIMFVSVPIMRLVSLAKREKSSDIPLVTDAAAYHEVAGRVVEALNKHGFGLRSTEPSWWVKAPTRILAWFGGASFSGLVPMRLEHYVGPGVEISFYTSGVLVRGKGARASWAHGLIAETAVHSRGLETFNPSAQNVERQIRRLWAVYDDAPEPHKDSEQLLARVRELARDLGQLDVDYEEWQLLYRQLLQVERAVRGERQLMDDASSSGPQKMVSGTEAPMIANANPNLEPKRAEKSETSNSFVTGAPARARADAAPRPPRSPETLSTPDLIREVMAEVEALVKAQLALAKAELRADLSTETRTIAGLGVAAVAGLITVNLLFVTAILALSTVLSAWEAGLVVSGATLLAAGVAGVVGWGKRVRKPLARTRHEFQEDVKWTKERTV